MKMLTNLIFCASALTAMAQTNAVFQDCRAGDLVKVTSEHPLLVLGKATLLEIGSNTVTVCTSDDRFTLDKTNVVLVPLPGPPAAAAAPTGPVPQLDSTAPPSATSAPPSDALQSLANGNPVQSLADVQDMVFGPHKNDPNYSKANDYYNHTMQGVLSGQISQDELVRQAKQVLKQCDAYKDERQKDPEYEKQIQALRVRSKIKAGFKGVCQT